jgi:hypothetical protein
LTDNDNEHSPRTLEFTWLFTLSAQISGAMMCQIKALLQGIILFEFTIFNTAKVRIDFFEKD